MTAPADLSKLRINRDAPSAPEKTALKRNLILFIVAAVIVAVAVFVFRERAVPQVQVATVNASVGNAGGGAAGGATSVTANGYVVARTKASVSAKTAGRLAYLGVSEGSVVKRGDVIARLDNADYQAAVSQAQANIASAEATVIEARVRPRSARARRESISRDPQDQSQPDVAAGSRGRQPAARHRPKRACGRPRRASEVGGSRAANG